MNDTSKFQPKRSIQECDDILTKTPGSMFETETKLINGYLQKTFVNTCPNLRHFWLNTASQHGPNDYILYEGERHSYAAVHNAACKAASVFYSAYGVRKGDRVGIIARNYPEWLITFWACQLLGAMAVGINAWLPIHGGRQSPLTHCITHTNCKVVVMDSERANILENWVAEGRKKTGLTAVLVIRSEDALELGKSKTGWKGMQKWEDVMGAHKGEINLWENELLCMPEDYFAILFTSGTTGLPKGVPITHRGWTANILNSTAVSVRHALRNGQTLPVPDPNAPQSAGIAPGPLFHVIGLMTSAGVTTQVGGRLILLKKWNSELAAQLIEREGVMAIGSVPSIVSDLIRSKLRFAKLPPTLITMGGAPVPPALMLDVIKNFPDAIPAQGYGLTETMGLAMGLCGSDFIARPSATGLPCLTLEITIVNTETLKAQKPGQMGEIWIRGSNVFRGYWNDPVATEKAITKDGWFRSGDVGYMDEEGFLYVKDRVKDIIIRGGENIDSSTVENAIYSHPNVHECAAVAVPDDRLGELVAVVVTARKEYKGRILEDELISIAKRRLPAFAVPVMILELDELVKNPAGKIVKKELRAIAKLAWERRRPGRVTAKL
ncbi:hypothetical protein FRB93_013114 [Tulasnella sp. JGI-2019a]|nr:hypothetical protein FRB93_013114 [Tulasnella sp. JGI-2019a]